MDLRQHLRRIRERRQLNRERLFRDRLNPLDLLNDREVYERYRFGGDSVVFIHNLVQHEIQMKNTNNAPSTIIMVCMTLRFYATGMFYNSVGDLHGLSKSTVCQTIWKVTRAIISLRNHFITFPRPQEAHIEMRQFQAIAGFPSIVGIVDGTQVKIISPSNNEVDYICRKGYHSLNVQIICDSKMRITNIVAKWPGSVHDSRIFRDSVICHEFQEGQHHGFLLGDSGYPCTNYMMTPFLRPNTDGEREFNRAHRRTRVLIEQSIGILKRRFSCLHGELRVKPERAVKIIVACAILHNIAALRNDVFADAGDQYDDDDNGNDGGLIQDAQGQMLRQRIVRNYFS